LADTVVDATEDNVQRDAATGFMFGPATADALAHAVWRTAQAFAQGPAWQKIVQRGMAQSFSWQDAATPYLALYEEAVAGKNRAA
jgi:starch synthase